jgi:putative redox protein
VGRKVERVRFEGAMGHRLAALLERPPVDPRAWALFAHCFSCSKDLKAVAWISRVLVEHHVGVLRFDFTGLGESEGDFSQTNLSSNVDDVVAAADYLRRRHRAPRLLIGHSLGGAAILAAAERIPETAALATLAMPSDTTHLSEGLIRMAPEIEDRGEAEIHLGGRTFCIRKQLIDDLRGRTLVQSVRELGRPLLVVHSAADEVVGIDHAVRIFEAAGHPKAFLSLEGADHLLMKDRKDARYVADVLVAWASRYLV